MYKFKLNGKDYQHEVFTRAVEIDRLVLVSNAPESISDEVIEEIAIGSVPVNFGDIDGHANLNSETGKWNDNKGEIFPTVEIGGEVIPMFSFRTFSNWEEFEAECK